MTIYPVSGYANQKFIVSPTAGQGNYTTIQAAITAASAGQTVFIRNGTYTENLTLKTGVDLVAFEAPPIEGTAAVTILGKCTYTGSGTVNISGIQLQTNSDYFLAVTGSGTSVVNIRNCSLICDNNTGIDFTTSGVSEINILYCTGNINTTGITYFTHSATSGTLLINYCTLYNSGGTSTASTISAGGFDSSYSELDFPITTSGTAATANFAYCNADPGVILWLTHNSTSANPSQVYFCDIDTGAAVAITVGAGASLNVFSCLFNVTTGANVITGAGTVTYSGLVAIDDIGITTSNQVNIPTPVQWGGTGAATLTGLVIGNGTSPFTASAVTQHDVLVGGASNAVTSVTPSTAQKIFVSNGTTSDPSFKTFSVVQQIFTTTSTYTPTSGMIYADIETWGGGGGGGGVSASAGTFGAGGGGGAGGYSQIISTAATVGVSQAVTIGAAGTAGSAGNNPGGNGGDTSVGAICIGKGGTGGGGSLNQTPGAGGAGGIAGTGTVTGTGQPGNGGIAAATVVTTAGGGGSGGSTLIGGGGSAITTGVSAGQNATGFGAGGSGGNTTNGSVAGGAGTAGYVRITEYVIS